MFSRCKYTFEFETSMKILHLIHKIQNRGAETFACQLAHHHKNGGHDVKIISIYNGVAQMPHDPKIECLNAEYSKRFYDLSSWKKIHQVITKFKPDIVQANAGDTLKYAVLSKLIYKWKAPLVFRNASEIGRYINSGFQKAYNTFLFKNVNYVISVSDASKKDFIKYFPFLEEKTEVIPVGLEYEESIQKKILEPKNAKHIIHVGGFSFEKNHKGLIRIFKNLKYKEKGAHLHLVGDGPLKKEIEEIVQKEGLSPYVHFHGFNNEPLPFIKAADVLVLPSIIEGLPGVLLEAMHCRTPVIAYNVGGISEIVNSNTGVLLSKDDEAGFSSALLDLLNKDNNSTVSNAYKMVKLQYMNEKIAEDFLKVYKNGLNL